MRHGSAKKERKSSERTLLDNLASHLRKRIDDGHMSCFEAYENTLSSLKQYDLADAEVARVRARIRWAEQGESSSSYFFRLEKKNAGDNWCAAIRNDEGQIV